MDIQLILSAKYNYFLVKLHLLQQLFSLRLIISYFVLFFSNSYCTVFYQILRYFLLQACIFTALWNIASSPDLHTHSCPATTLLCSFTKGWNFLMNCFVMTISLSHWIKYQYCLPHQSRCSKVFLYSHLFQKNYFIKKVWNNMLHIIGN